MTRFCTAWHALPETVTDAGVAKRVLGGEHASLVEVRIPAGTPGARHSHPHEQFVQVIAGTGRITTAQGECAFAPGSLFHFPAHTWHAAQFDSDTVLVETNLHATGDEEDRQAD